MKEREEVTRATLVSSLPEFLTVDEASTVLGISRGLVSTLPVAASYRLASSADSCASNGRVANNCSARTGTAVADSTAADLVIETFAQSELALVEQLALTEEDARVWEIFAKATIHRIYDLERLLQAARRQNQALRDELRRYTAAAVSVERAVCP